MSIQPGLYRRESGGLRNVNTGELRPGPAPVPPDDFFLVGTTVPTAANTGVRDPSLLVRRDGNLTTTANGQVIRNLDVYGEIVVRHEDVLIENCIVRGPATPFANGGCITATAGTVSRLVVDRVLIAPQTPSYFLNGIQGHDFTASRVHVRDVIDYFGLFNQGATRVNNTYPLNVRLEGVYGERMAYFQVPTSVQADGETHNDGAQVQGGQGMEMIGCRIRAVYGPAGSAQPPASGPTPAGPTPSLACVLFNNNVGTTGLHLIVDNWFEGGYVPINCGGAPGVNLGTLHRNRFDGLSGTSSGGIPATVWKLNSQTLDAGVGTRNQNVFTDGTPITVRSFTG